MKDPKKAKWLIGASGAILSALLLTQMNNEPQAETNTDNTTALNEFSASEQKNMNKREKELVQLDWTNFEVQAVTPQQQMPVQSDRRTSRS